MCPLFQPCARQSWTCSVVLPSSFFLLLRIETANVAACSEACEPCTASTIRAKCVQRKKKHQKARIDAASSGAPSGDANVLVLLFTFLRGAHMTNWNEL